MEKGEEFKGLSEEEVVQNRARYGNNRLLSRRESFFKDILFPIIREPLFIMLVLVALIYLSAGDYNDSLIMIAALVFISGISLFQESRSRNALAALKKISAPTARIIREGRVSNIDWDEVVVNDVLRVEQGMIVPADAIILKGHDFSVDESILSGESLPVLKNGNGEVRIYQGTIALSGYCLARVEKTGMSTEMGRIGKSLTGVPVVKTPLEDQIREFVKKMVLAGALAFLLVFFFNYLRHGDAIRSLLAGLTLAMSLLPEEIPVAFSTFMALGALKLYRKKVIARNAHAVETLGAATVICIDKTGTITENRMELAAIYDFEGDRLTDLTKGEELTSYELLRIAQLASESTPFNTMEKCIHAAYHKVMKDEETSGYTLVREYPLEGTPPVMSHAYRTADGGITIATKGSVETILRQTSLSEEVKNKLERIHSALASRGFRILGVAQNRPGQGASIPENQSALQFQFTGMLAFYDPPKPGISETFQQINHAGIRLKMITGDHPETALAIARQTGLSNNGHILTGEQISRMAPGELQKSVNEVDIYARMHPDAKLKIIEALRANGEVIAMSGDGVNDAPALKAAHIGVAMGKRGNEVAKGAASLILMDDELAHLVEAIAIGRRIYENLKKAIRYIIAIHIPIILIVVLPLMFGWEFTGIFLPVHIVFLELIMGPTCSIIFENEPADPDSMKSPPRGTSKGFFSLKELSTSISQGMLITTLCLLGGYFYLSSGKDQESVRSIIFATLIFSNVFLTLSYRSFSHSILKTLKYRNKLIPLIIVLSVGMLLSTIWISPLREQFGFASLSAIDLLLSVSLGLIAVLWFEVVKAYKSSKAKTTKADSF